MFESVVTLAKDKLIILGAVCQRRSQIMIGCGPIPKNNIQVMRPRLDENAQGFRLCPGGS